MSEPIELQEQIELMTPHGHKVVIRGYSTGRIRQAISAAYSEGVKLEMTGEKDKDGKAISRTIVSGDAAQKTTNAALSNMVLSVDDQTVNVLDRVLDLPEEDYDYVRTEVDKVRTPLAEKNDSN